MVPSGWTISNLKDITRKIQDGNYGGDYPTKDELVKKGVPFLTSKVLGGNGRINSSKYDFITPEKHLKLKKAQITTNDILFTNRGANVGVVAIAGIDLVDANIGPQLTLIRTNKELADNKYLFFAMSSSFFQRQVKGQDSGSAMNFFGIKATEKFKIPVPPLPEQQKIARILSTWDKAITNTEKRIDNSKQQKKALMQQLLTGKKRFPGFEGDIKRYSFADLVDIDEKSLGSKTPDSYHFFYISISDVETGNISGSLEYHTYSDAPSRARRVVKKGDILLSTVRPNLKGFARVSNEHDGHVASTGFSVLTPKNNVSGDYVYHYLFSCHLTGQINSLVVGSNYPAINSSDVKGLKIYCPSYEEQMKIASVLNNCDETINSLAKNLADLKQEKNALMQQLLTGKRRVKIDEAEVA